MIEETAVAFNEAEEFLVVLEATLPDERAIAKNPEHHFLVKCKFCNPI